MRAAGIAGVSRRRSAPITTRQATDHHPASDLVRRNFMAERPNELRVADITFLPTLAGFLPCGRSRRLVAPDRRMGLLGRSEDPRRARRSRQGAHGPKARNRRPSIGSRLAIHVGRFRRSLQALAFGPSTGLAATPTTMRCARVSSPPSNASGRRPPISARRGWPSSQFIEGFYNPSRRHSALGYLSPIEYERKHDGPSKPA